MPPTDARRSVSRLSRVPTRSGLALLGAALVVGLLLALMVAGPSLAEGDPDAHRVMLLLPTELPAQLPAGLDAARARDVAARLAVQRASGAMPELARLQAEGRIASFEVAADLCAIAVTLAEPGVVPADLNALPGIEGVRWAEGDLADLVDRRETMVTQLLAASHAATGGGGPALMGGGAGPVVAPTRPLEVYVNPEEGHGIVSGLVEPGATVSVTVRSGDGTVQVATVVQADGSGVYSVAPVYDRCAESWTFLTQPGDTVEVVVGGMTYTTTIPLLIAWLDPVDNTVCGQTVAGAQVEAVLSFGESLCATETYTETKTADGAGAFCIDYAETIDFDGRAQATVTVVDAGGSCTYVRAYAFHMGMGREPSYLSGYLRPDERATVTLWRGGTLRDIVTAGVDKTGYWETYMALWAEAGDLISVTNSSGDTMVYTVDEIEDVRPDPLLDHVQGRTGADRRVGVIARRETGYPGYGGCLPATSCDETTSDGSGLFALDTGLALVRGDEVEVTVYDAMGNYRRQAFRAPLVRCDPILNRVDGVWSSGGGNLTVTQTRGEAVEYQTRWLSVGSQTLGYDLWLTDLQVGDRIEVGDGTYTTTHTVADVTVLVDTASEQITGQAPGGRLLLNLSYLDRAAGTTRMTCLSTEHAGGAYALSPAGVPDLGAQDACDVWATGANGNQTHAYGHAFEITVGLIAGAFDLSAEVSGYTVSGGVAVSVTVRDGEGVVVDEDATMSSSRGYYELEIAGAALDYVIAVEAADGWSAQVGVPEVSAAVESSTTGLHVVGQLPSGEFGQLDITRPYKSTSVMSYWVQADGQGNYDYDLSADMWQGECNEVWRTYPCVVPTIRYFGQFGHEVAYTSATYAISADPYEDDDTVFDAKVIVTAQTQHRTFHAADDVDWIRFSVPESHIRQGVPYRIETYNLGQTMDTLVILYDVDGQTELASNDDAGTGLGSLILWTPPAAGSYMIAVERADAAPIAFDLCDAVYDVWIGPAEMDMFLPLVCKSWQ